MVDTAINENIWSIIVKEDLILHSSPVSLSEDIKYFDKKLSEFFDWYANLNAARKAVCIDICLVIGLCNFLKLDDFIEDISFGDYKKAANNILKYTKNNKIIAKNAKTLVFAMINGSLVIKDEEDLNENDIL